MTSRVFFAKNCLLKALIHMVNQLITITEAADLIDKSIQTIRRLIKGGKVKYRRKKTPQGFNYMIDKASLMEVFDMAPQQEQPSSFQKPEMQEPTRESATQSAQEPSRQQQPIHEPYRDESTYSVDTEPAIYILESEDYMPHDITDEIEPAEEPTFETTERVERYAATSQDAGNQTAAIIDKLLDQQRIDKEKLYQVLEAYQQRVLVLEDQIKQIQAPKKSWWAFWK